MYNINDFRFEISHIGSEKLASFVTACLLRAPDYFYTMPASTTGNYHPAYCFGEGGLVRHVKASVAIAIDLLRLEQYGRKYINRDLVLAALILHDIVKKDPVKNETAFLHPLLGADFVENMVKECDEDIQKQAKEIARLIRSHMGQWTTSDHCPGITLPKPQQLDEQFVHLCDYLASRQDITVELRS